MNDRPIDIVGEGLTTERTTATSPLFNLEGPIYDTLNSINVLEMVLETVTECKHPLPDAQVDGYIALLLRKKDMDALLFALYRAGNSAQTAVDAFHGALEGWNTRIALDKAA